MYNKLKRDDEYIDNLKEFICLNYGIDTDVITPATRGYYGETWRLQSPCGDYFAKLDYFPRHQILFQNSLPVMEYLRDNGIDFIGKIVKTKGGGLHAHFGSAVLAVFEWIDGENVETDETKTAEYNLLCKIYQLTKHGFNIPTVDFSDATARRFYSKWDELKNTPESEDKDSICKLLEQNSERLLHWASRLSYFASMCQQDTADFFITHGDAGGNFFIGADGKHHIVDWDEVQYAPLERDAWVMGCRDWARELFDAALKAHNINYKLRPKRIAFYCYHMYFLYLVEFVEDFLQHGIVESVHEYFDEDYFMYERMRFADDV